MPAIGIGNSIVFKRGGGVSWSSYWATRNPQNLIVNTITDVRIDLSWMNEGTADYTGHKIYYSTDGINFSLLTTIASIGTTYSATGLTLILFITSM